MKLNTQPTLPSFDSVYSTKDVRFEVYRAKDLYSSKWRHPALHKLVSVARTSYHRYGPRDLFDRYDEKAAVYLVRACYFRKNILVNEWLSVRMVPGDGVFEGVGELELYTFNNRRVPDLLREKMKIPVSVFWKNIISDSRLCGIHPYKILPRKKISSVTVSHAYTPECMALMQVQFMLDYPPETIKFQYVTAIVKPEIRDKVITHRKGKKTTKPNFIPGHKLLKLPNNSFLSVDRNTYTYEFPIYWLDMSKLKSLLKKLLRDKRLTRKTLEYYLNVKSLDKSGGEIKLAKMLTVKGQLVGSYITGEELRALIDKNVPDAPELQITPIALWRKGFLKMLSVAGINVLALYPELNRFLN